MRMLVVFTLLVLGLWACVRSEGASGVSAQWVPGPGGVDCYAILDADGHAVGGNCFRSN